MIYNPHLSLAVDILKHLLNLKRFTDPFKKVDRSINCVER